MQVFINNNKHASIFFKIKNKNPKNLHILLITGHYVPQLAKKIIDYNSAYSRPIINLKGFIVSKIQFQLYKYD